MITIRPGKLKVGQFNISSRAQRSEYEAILNSPQCQIIDRNISHTSFGETIVYIEYYDRRGKND